MQEICPDKQREIKSVLDAVRWCNERQDKLQVGRAIGSMYYEKTQSKGNRCTDVALGLRALILAN